MSAMARGSRDMGNHLAAQRMPRRKWDMGAAVSNIVGVGFALVLASSAIAADLQAPIPGIAAATNSDGALGQGEIAAADAAPEGVAPPSAGRVQSLSADKLFAGPGSAPQPGAVPAPAHGRVPTVRFRSERDAFRIGIREYNSGSMTSAVQALEYAATRGHSPAQWKLGRMYAEGDGVPHDDLKAFEYFSRVIDNADDSSSRAARFISNAYVALGGYYLDGIPGSYVVKDQQRARAMFHHAASFYGDPDAQYNLARLCLSGDGGAKDARLAARWLHLAAEKNHIPSQALLGHLLLTGQGNITRHPSRGFMWLTMARNAADPQKDAWIFELYEQANALLSEADRANAQAFLANRAPN
ncbi:Sel1 repeat protein [Ostertagia ostertagi]